MINEEIMKRVQNFRLMDDIFFNTFMQDSEECMEYVLNVIMDRTDLQVKRIETQMDIPGVMARGVRFDVFCTDNEGREYDFEVQNTDREAIPKRARYNSSMMDYLNLKSGQKWTELPKVTVLLITENDVLGGNKQIYHISRTIKEMDYASFGDEADIIYVNGAYRDKTTKLGQLMEDFHCVNPEDMNSEILKSRAKFLKSSEEKVSSMCKSVEDYVEVVVKGIKEAAEREIKEAKEAKEAAEKEVKEAEELSKLQTWLADNNRTEELIKSLKDLALKEKLLKEYHEVNGKKVIS